MVRNKNSLGVCMSATVTIVRFHKIGGPEVLQFDELPLPEPAHGEVRLRVKAIGLNRAEIMFRNDRYLETPILPPKNGYEASGIVEAIGPGVAPSWIGKTASTVPGFFKLNEHGVYGEVAIVPASPPPNIPPGSPTNKEPPSDAVLTAYGGLIMLGHPTKGDFCLITAASSRLASPH
jgi:NADPH:quinone reductase-like Zn-dependent oxidoreductase